MAGSTDKWTVWLDQHGAALVLFARQWVPHRADAEDVVQEAYLRAFKFFGGYQGGDARSWVLKIVRNTSYRFLEKNRPGDLAQEFDETIHTTSTDRPGATGAEAALVQSAENRMLHDALGELPVNYREVLVLRELEGMSYKEIAELMGYAHRHGDVRSGSRALSIAGATVTGA